MKLTSRTTRVRAFSIAGAVLLPLLTLPVHARAQSAPPTSSAVTLQSSPYRCVPRTAQAAPPLRLAPVPLAYKHVGAGQPQPVTLRPLCGPGLVPVATIIRRPGAPKGNPLLGRKPGLLAATPSPQPAGPMGPMCRGIQNAGGCYYYGDAAYTPQAGRGGSDGGGMTQVIERPTGVSGTGHSLDEISAQGGPGNGNIVELGWNVDLSLYGDSNTHLFVFHWKGWVPTCYNGCNWQQYSATYFPGMNLNPMLGQHVYIGYVYYKGNWWAWFNDQWLGYFPGSEWSGKYTKSQLLQWFGEVESWNSPPGTQMGNGQFPPPVTAASMSTLCDVDASAWVCWYRDLQTISATVPAYYNIAHTGFGAVRYGGPGL